MVVLFIVMTIARRRPAAIIAGTIATVSSAVTTVAPTTIATVAPSAMLCHKFHCQDRLIQLSAIDFIPSSNGMFNILKLHKGVISLHFNSNQLAVGFKEHAQVIAFRSLFGKVDNEESFRGLNAFATIIFFALDASITTSKLDTLNFLNFSLPSLFAMQLL